ncbi:Glutamate [NMDA] receptor subunit 1 [Tetrabaena socialis]|uniref:Glutamate [NMDA] receptor subunit 1 n=1 Tax=Tetrabaena socialis TaxID=47790 RepID=A0A2J8AC58_9CHLO|nr:Glutamate [NMDA] receptor subunit 1 [Tetrabaena socialis]|eukprot:PNH10073.1 Glutamate [NMDA] receptor subunit 1 [Tetrabaena socialis]
MLLHQQTLHEDAGDVPMSLGLRRPSVAQRPHPKALVRDNLLVGVNPNGSTAAYFAYSFDSLATQLQPNVRYCATPTCVQWVKDGKISAFVSDRPLLQYQANQPPCDLAVSLVRDNLLVGVNPNGSTAAYFAYSFDSLATQLQPNVRYCATPTCVQWVKDGIISAFVSDKPLLQYQANQPPCNLAVVGDAFGPGNLVIGLQKGSPLLPIFNSALQRFVEDGTLTALHRSWFDEQSQCTTNSSLDNNRLGIPQMLGAFVVLAAGIALAFMFGTIENLRWCIVHSPEWQAREKARRRALGPFDSDPEAAGRLPELPGGYLYPVLAWGPNNQVAGLKEALVLGRLLKRTVILHDARESSSGNSGYPSPPPPLGYPPGVHPSFKRFDTLDGEDDDADDEGEDCETGPQMGARNSTGYGLAAAVRQAAGSFSQRHRQQQQQQQQGPPPPEAAALQRPWQNAKPQGPWGAWQQEPQVPQQHDDPAQWVKPFQAVLQQHPGAGGALSARTSSAARLAAPPPLPAAAAGPLPPSRTASRTEPGRLLPDPVAVRMALSSASNGGSAVTSPMATASSGAFEASGNAGASSSAPGGSRGPGGRPLGGWRTGGGA